MFSPLFRWRWYLALYVVAFSVLDVLLTQRLLASGRGVEGNPIMAPIAHTWLLWPVRAGIPLIFIWLNIKAMKYGPMAFAAVVYGAVVAWNFHLEVIR